MYHGYDRAVARIKDVFAWTYSSPAYERLCDLIAQLIIKAGNLRDEGQGENYYMTNRVMSTVDKHLGEGWVEYKHKTGNVPHVYVVSFGSKFNESPSEDYWDWVFYYFSPPKDEDIAKLMLYAEDELDVERVTKATVRCMRDGQEHDEGNVVREIHHVFNDDNNDRINYLPIKWIGENEYYPEKMFYIDVC